MYDRSMYKRSTQSMLGSQREWGSSGAVKDEQVSGKGRTGVDGVGEVLLRVRGPDQRPQYDLGI